MVQKAHDDKGLTLVEMLCATLILIMLTLMLNTGMQLAMESYRSMVMYSEVNLLLSSLSDVVADELRYASNAAQTPDTVSPNVTYNSLLYGQGTKLSVGDGTGGRNKGQIYAVVPDSTDSTVSNAFPVLPDASYGGQSWIYGVSPADGMSITYDVSGQSFEVKIKVSEMQADGTFSGLSAEQTFHIRCLNP